MPLTPTMLRLLTLPRRRKSKRVSPTTPTFLSEADAAPSTKPVVYSPVPICKRVNVHPIPISGIQALMLTINTFMAIVVEIRAVTRLCLTALIARGRTQLTRGILYQDN